MQEAIEVARKIEAVIKAIRDEGARSEVLIEARAKAISEYDKSIASSILKLKESGTPATVSEKVAKGERWELRYAMEVAEGTYKAHFARLNYLQSQLNGYQSVNKFLAVT